MKLIKQNDSAGGLIFKQNQNGKAMKQNYVFGRGLKTYLQGASLKLNVNIEISDQFTIGFFYKSLLTGAVLPPFLYTNLISTVFELRRTGPAGNEALHFRFRGNNTNSNIKESLFAAIYDETSMKMFTNNNSLFNYGTKLNEKITEFNIVDTLNATIYSKISDLFVYYRALTVDELLYKKNNNLGNELLNTSGIYAYFSMSKCDIVEVDGVDTIVIRDLSGKNNHLIVNGLPAGTLQEQLDYANANLFEPW